MLIQKPDIMRGALAIALLLSFQIALAALFRFQVPETNRDMVIYMLGQLSGMVTTALAFYFATSKSSHDKNAVIAGLSDGAAAGPVLPEPLDLTGADLPRAQGGGQ